MIHVALSIPEAELGWARSRVEAGEVASLDALVADLLRQKREEAEDAAYVQAAIDEGLASGVDPRPAEQIFAEVRAKYFGRDG
jgi:Arc/MetJ-type ribon-helix-helix transcriptional regulator